MYASGVHTVHIYRRIVSYYGMSKEETCSFTSRNCSFTKDHLKSFCSYCRFLLLQKRENAALRPESKKHYDRIKNIMFFRNIIFIEH